MGAGVWLIVILLAVAAVTVIVLTVRHKRVEEEAKQRYSHQPEPEEQVTERLGALIFSDEKINGKFVPLKNPGSGDVVWCITPYGVMRGEIITATTEDITIDCGDYEVYGKFCRNYFSQSMADKLDVMKSGWIVSDLKGTADLWRDGQETRLTLAVLAFGSQRRFGRIPVQRGFVITRFSVISSTS